MRGASASLSSSSAAGGALFFVCFLFLVWSPPGLPEALLLEKCPGPGTASLNGEHGGRLLLTHAFSSLSPRLSSCDAARRPVVCHE